VAIVPLIALEAVEKKDSLPDHPLAETNLARLPNPIAVEIVSQIEAMKKIDLAIFKMIILTLLNLTLSLHQLLPLVKFAEKILKAMHCKH